MSDSWGATVWSPWTNNGQRHDRPDMSSPSIWTNTVGTTCPGQELWGGLITQRSRVQTPSPRPRRRRSERGPPSADPFPSPKVRTNSNTRPHGEDASSFVDIADERIRDHAHEELNSGPSPHPSRRGRRGDALGRVASARRGELCPITGLTCGDGTRRSSGKPIVSWSDLVIGRRPRSGIRIRSSRWGSAPFRLGIGGLRRVLPAIPTNRHGVISFAAAGAEGVVVAPIT
jgi:hypothetical protein